MVVEVNGKGKQPVTVRGRAKSPASITFGENAANKRQRQSVNLTGQVTVDTSRARSNTDVVRSCVEQLGWKEVYNTWNGCEIMSGRHSRFMPGELVIFVSVFFSALQASMMENHAIFIGMPTFIPT